MIFIVGKRFVNLTFREGRETSADYRIDGLAVLQESNHVMNGNPATFYSRIPAPYVRRSHNIPIRF